MKTSQSLVGDVLPREQIEMVEVQVLHHPGQGKALCYPLTKHV